jgi:hypothetical protein
MSFFSSLAKSVGGIVGGAVGTLILPGAGTALGAALGGAAGGAIGGGGGGGGAPAPSTAPAPTYHAVQMATRLSSYELAQRSMKSRSSYQPRSLAPVQQKKAPSMSTGAKIGLAVGGGAALVGTGTAITLLMRRRPRRR